MLVFAQVLQAVELFAGRSVVTRCFRAVDLKAAGLDLLYWPSFQKRSRKKGKRPCKNFFDILSPSGFCAALLACLACAEGGHVVVLAVVCSSFVSISRGSTGRSYLNPSGWLHVKAVACGNTLAARCACCLALSSCTASEMQARLDIFILVSGSLFCAT